MVSENSKTKSDVLGIYSPHLYSLGDCMLCSEKLYVLCKALHNKCNFHCKGREQCYRNAVVSADAKSRALRTKVKVKHLRQGPPLARDFQ